MNPLRQTKILFQWQTLYANATKISEESRQNLFKVLEFLDMFLEGKQYLTGSDEPTLADVISFVSITNVVVSFNNQKFDRDRI